MCVNALMMYDDYTEYHRFVCMCENFPKTP